MATKKMTIQDEFNDILSNQPDDVKQNKAYRFINKANRQWFHVRLKALPHVDTTQQKGLAQVRAMAEALAALTPKQRPPRLRAIEQYGPAEVYLWGVYTHNGKVQPGISNITLSALHRWAIATTGEGLEIYYHGRQV